ncbi:MAG: hypothetical protein U0441_37390 [Polyangiaceae bacterium]
MDAGGATQPVAAPAGARHTARLAAILVGGALILGAGRAHGDDAAVRARAREAYDRGVAAQSKGAFAEAARAFATADALVPSPAALGAALEAAAAADDAVLGAELCDRAAARSADGSVPTERRAQCDAARRRTGRLTPSADATIDGASVKAGRAAVVLPGAHTVRAGTWSRTVTIAGGEAAAIEVPAGAGAEAASAGAASGAGTAAGAGAASGSSGAGAASGSSGNAGDPAMAAGGGPRISPVWAVTAGAVTAVAAGFTIASAIDTKEKHDAFVALGCDGPKHGDCTERARHGAFAQDRTNVLIGVTAGLAVAASVLTVITIFGGRGAPPAKAPATSGGPATSVRGEPGASQPTTSAAIVVGPAALGLRVTFR